MERASRAGNLEPADDRPARDLSPGQERRVLDLLGRERAEPAGAQDAVVEGDGENLLDRVLGGCRLESRIGRGGMGQVFLAHHIALDAPVAVKVLDAGPALPQGLVERFRREAHLAARLDHPNVVRILHAGEEGGLSFIVMEHVNGESLERRIAREGRLPVAEALRIAAEAAHGLDAVHSLGIVHRDVKPGNLLLTRNGTVKVADFGLARLAQFSSRVTGPGQVVGTPHFMAPEQLGTGPVDARTDLYALGATLYAMLAGDLPWKGDTPGTLLGDIVRSPFPSLAASLPDVPREVEALVGRLTEKDPGRRFASARELLDALRAVGSGAAPAELPPPAATESRQPPRTRRLPRRAAAVALLVAAVLVAAAVVLLPRDGEDGNGGGPEPPVAGGPEPAGMGHELAEAPSWPRGWRRIVDGSSDGWPEIPLGSGWQLAGDVLEAGANAGHQVFKIDGEQFLLDFDVAFTTEDRGLEIEMRSGAEPGEGCYRLTWRDGERLEWWRTSPQVALVRKVPPVVGPSGEACRVRVLWLAPACLVCEIGGSARFAAEDPDPPDRAVRFLRIAPAGPMRIPELHLKSPPRGSRDGGPAPGGG